MTDSAPSGWHPDPHNTGNERFWTGIEWSDQVRPAQATPPAPGPPPESPNSPKKAWWKRWWAIVLWLLLALMIISAIAAPSDTADDDTSEAVQDQTTIAATSSDKLTEETPTTQEVTTTTEATTTTAEATTTTEASTIIDAGTYVVGSEIEPGVYRVARYWALLDENQDIIENELTSDGLGLVNIPASAKFIEFSGPAIRIEDSNPIDPIAENLTGGTYLVGFDIAPGTYRVSNESAYGVRLDSDMNIIDNALNDGSVILTVKDTDWAFSFTGTLELIE